MVDLQGLPYVVPMNFGYRNNILYLHSAPDSGCLDFLQNNPQICITFCTSPSLKYYHEQVACSYRMKGSSVICRGKVEFIEDIDEKIIALDVLMKQYSAKKFTYSDPAVRNVKVWKVIIHSKTGRHLGMTNPKSRNRHQ